MKFQVVSSSNDDSHVPQFNITEHVQMVQVSGGQILQLTETHHGSETCEMDMTNGDVEFLTVDPNVYYVVEENGAISIQMLNQHDEMNELLAVEQTPRSGANIFSHADHQEQPSSAEGMNCVLPRELILPKAKTRKRTTQKRKREESEELTSIAYRNRLLQSTAEKEVKNIRKVQRKNKRKKDDSVGNADVLCPLCGVCFSDSVDGKGWMMCIRCHEWYHSECGNFDQMICEACS